MLQSMTGFGKAEKTFQNKKITVEIRSLNSKNGDIYIKLPSAYKSFELPIRKIIDQELVRGKIECIISIDFLEGKEKPSINKNLAIAYFKEMSSIAEEVGVSKDELLNSIFRLQDVMQSQEEEINDEEWNSIEKAILEACQKLTEYRIKEGESLERDLTNAISIIEEKLHLVPQYEKARIDKIRERMQKGLEEFKEAIDENRFEQELIYYIEKLDINEEKTRLQHHLDYFRSTLKGKESSGKKLGFIAQEMGREINTLGSKSYDADLQKIVIEMKDYLEKIKEQVLNAL